MNADRIAGSCGAWQSWENAVTKQAFTEVLDRVEFLHLTGRNWTSGEVGTTAVCDDRKSLKKMASFISDLGKHESGLNTTLPCKDAMSSDTTEWTLKKCGPGSFGFCANCSDPCTSDACGDFAVSACSSSFSACQKGHDAISVMGAYFTSPEPLPEILSMSNVTKTKSTVAVEFEVSVDGFMTCQVFPIDFVIGSVDDILFTGTTVEISQLKAAFVFSGLTGATNYHLACATQTEGGRVMSLTDVLSNTIPFKTECCKSVLVGMYLSDVRKGEIPRSTLSITLEALPSSTLVLRTLLNGNSNGVEPKAPFVARFNDEVSLGPHDVRVDSSVLDFGTYDISVDLSGAAAKEYEVVFVDSDGYLTVRSLYDEPTTPTLVSATLMYESTSIALLFSGATDQADLDEDCSALFKVNTGFSGLKCLWVNDREVRVSLSADHDVSSITTFTVRSGLLKAKCITNADCSTWAHVAQTSVSLVIPEAISKPTVSLGIPQTLGMCMNLTIDVDQSTGSVGKAWKSVSFTIGGRNVSSADYNVTGFLATRPAYTQPFLLPHTLLIPGNKYTLRSEVCNYWGACATATKSVVVLRDFTPSISIVGASPRYIQRFHTLSLRANLQLSPCNATFPANLQYSWLVLDNGVPSPAIVSTSNKIPSRFVLDKYTLDVGHTYIFTATVVDTDSGGSSSDQTIVMVNTGEVVASLKGSIHRTVALGSVIDLDVSSSYDEDYPDDKSALSFEWSCSQLRPVFLDGVCGVQIVGGEGTGVLSVFANETVSHNTTSQFGVVVKGSEDRIDTVTVTVEVTSSVAPQIEFTSTAVKFNPSDKIIVSADVSVTENGGAEWSVRRRGATENLDISSIALSIPFKALKGPSAQGLGASAVERKITASNLVLGRHVLQEDVFYVFTLMVNTATTGKAISEYTIQTNSGPRPGTYIVSPLSGTELRTNFKFYSSNWDDPDIPITYEFSYFVGGTKMIFQSRSEINVRETTMPAGRNTLDYRFTTAVEVFDILGAGTTLTEEIRVEKAANIQLADVGTALSANIDTAFERGDYDGVKTGLSAGATMLNYVDCSLADATYCGDLNRFPCDKSINTCGACLEGFVGEEGDANSICVSEASARRRRLYPSDMRAPLRHDYRRKLVQSEIDAGSNEVYTSAMVEVCEVDNDCSDAFALCDTEIKRCFTPLKQCTQKCSGRGRCEYRSATGNLPLVSGKTCELGDVTCVATCVCRKGFYGASCSYTTADLMEREAIKDGLVKTLIQLVDAEDATKEALNLWVNSLVSLSKQEDDITMLSSQGILTVLKSVLETGANLDIAYPVIETLTLPIDAVSDKFGMTTTYNLLQDYSNLVAYDMTYGEKAVEIISKRHRIRIDSVELIDEFGYSSTLPLTTLESAASLGENSTGVQIFTKPSTEIKDLKMSQIMVDSRLFRASKAGRASSDVVSVQFHSNSSDFAAYLTDSLLIALKNINPVDYSAPNIRQPRDWQRSLRTECYLNETRVVERTCPVSRYVIRHVCDGTPGEYITECPSYSVAEKPVCTSLMDGGDLTGRTSNDELACTLVDYTEHVTLCSCPLEMVVVEGFVNAPSPGTRQGVIVGKEETMHSDEADTIFIHLYPEDLRDADVLVASIAGILVCSLLVYMIGLESSLDAEDHDGEGKVLPEDILLSRKRLDVIYAGLPSILNPREESIRERFFKELRVFHKWIMPFCRDVNMHDRSRGLVIILFNVLTAAAVAASMYDYSDPDDSLCYQFKFEEDCTHRSSPFYNEDQKCHWNGHMCQFRQPKDSMGSLFVAACFVTLIASPLTSLAETVLKEALFRHVYRAPCVSKGAKKASEEVDRTSMYYYVASFFYSSEEDFVSIRSEVDLRYFQREILKHRMKIGSDAIRERFDNKWGSVPRLKWHEGVFGDERGKAKAHVLKDYGNEIHAAVRAANKLRPEILRRLDPIDLERRLMGQLFSDLLPTVDGRILRYKLERDAPEAKSVSPFTRLLASVFITTYFVVGTNVVVNYTRDRKEEMIINWLLTLTLWFVVDFCIIRPGIIFIGDFMLPLYPWNNLYTVIRNIYNKMSEGESGKQSQVDGQVFYGAGMLFASTRIATWYPNSRVSACIKQFSGLWERVYLHNQVQGARSSLILSNFRVPKMKGRWRKMLNYLGALKALDVVATWIILAFLSVPEGVRATLLEYLILVLYTCILFLYLFMVQMAPDYAFVPLLGVLSAALFVYVYTDVVYDTCFKEKLTGKVGFERHTSFEQRTVTDDVDVLKLDKDQILSLADLDMVEDRARLTLTPGSMGARVLPITTGPECVLEDDDEVSDTNDSSESSIGPRDPYTNTASSSSSDSDSSDADKKTKEIVWSEPEVVRDLEPPSTEANATKVPDAHGNALKGRISIVQGPRVIHDQHHVKKHIAFIDVDVSSEEGESDSDTGMVIMTNTRSNNSDSHLKSTVKENSHVTNAVTTAVDVSEIAEVSLFTSSSNKKIDRGRHIASMRRAVEINLSSDDSASDSEGTEGDNIRGGSPIVAAEEVVPSTGVTFRAIKATGATTIMTKTTTSSTTTSLTAKSKSAADEPQNLSETSTPVIRSIVRPTILRAVQKRSFHARTLDLRVPTSDTVLSDSDSDSGSGGDKLKRYMSQSTSASPRAPVVRAQRYDSEAKIEITEHNDALSKIIDKIHISDDDDDDDNDAKD